MSLSFRAAIALVLALFAVIWVVSVGYALSGDGGAMSAVVGIPIGAAYLGLMFLVLRWIAR